MLIRPAEASDRAAIARIIMPTIRAGEVFALDMGMSEADALDYWLAADRSVFVAEHDGDVLGTCYIRVNQAGGGDHVANGGYNTAAAAAGRGVARAMCAHSLDVARSQGFRAMQYNFVVSSNVRAVALWEAMGFAIVGRLPGAFRHPTLGFVDALVMFRDL